MTKAIITLLFAAITLTTSAQIKSEGERFDDLSNYLDISITFNQNIDAYAIMDEGYIDSLSPALRDTLRADSILVLEMFWYGSVHNYGKCRIRVTKERQRFLFCAERVCYLFIVNKQFEGKRKLKLEFEWKNAEMTVWELGDADIRYF